MAQQGVAKAADTQRDMVLAQGVVKTFGQGERQITALDNVSVAIRENEFFTLLGPSGCGKTTLLRLIAGFDLPDRGNILLDGQEIGHLPPYKRPVNTVFQNYALFPHMSVARNIGFGLEMQGRPEREIREATDRMLALVQMEHLADRQTDQLSGGQQQRVALARALAPHPKVLLLDEPLSALDLKLRKEMQIELKRLQHETGITFVFVTHDQEEALTMSDRIAVMEGGNVLQLDTPTGLYETPRNRKVASFIGTMNFFDGKVASVNGQELTIDAAGLGRITAPKRQTTYSEGDAVQVAIRPEKLRLTETQDSGRGHSITGQLHNAAYLGERSHFYVKVDGADHPVAVSSQNIEGTGTGFDGPRPVWLSWHPDAAVVL